MLLFSPCAFAGGVSSEEAKILETLSLQTADPVAVGKRTAASSETFDGKLAAVLEDIAPNRKGQALKDIEMLEETMRSRSKERALSAAKVRALAGAYIELGKPQRAADLAQELLRKNQKDPVGHWVMAGAYAKSGNFAKAASSALTAGQNTQDPELKIAIKARYEDYKHKSSVLGERPGAREAQSAASRSEGETVLHRLRNSFQVEQVEGGLKITATIPTGQEAVRNFIKNQSVRLEQADGKALMRMIQEAGGTFRHKFGNGDARVETEGKHRHNFVVTDEVLDDPNKAPEMVYMLVVANEKEAGSGDVMANLTGFVKGAKATLEIKDASLWTYTKSSVSKISKKWNLYGLVFGKAQTGDTSAGNLSEEEYGGDVGTKLYMSRNQIQTKDPVGAVRNVLDSEGGPKAYTQADYDRLSRLKAEYQNK